MVREYPTHMMQAGLASTVGESFQRRNSQAIDTANVDDSSWVVRRRSLLQQGRDQLCEVEDSVEVKRKDPSPRSRRVFIVGGAPVRSGVVHQDMEL